MSSLNSVEVAAKGHAIARPMFGLPVRVRCRFPFRPAPLTGAGWVYVERARRVGRG